MLIEYEMVLVNGIMLQKIKFFVTLGGKGQFKVEVKI